MGLLIECTVPAGVQAQRPSLLIACVIVDVIGLNIYLTFANAFEMRLCSIGGAEVLRIRAHHLALNLDPLLSDLPKQIYFVLGIV